MESKDLSINITSYFRKHFYIQSLRILWSDMVTITTVDKIFPSLFYAYNRIVFPDLTLWLSGTSQWVEYTSDIVVISRLEHLIGNVRFLSPLFFFWNRDRHHSICSVSLGPWVTMTRTTHAPSPANLWWTYCIGYQKF